MAGKSINEYGAFTGNPDAVNILVQEKSQGTDHSQAEHKKADLDALLNKKIVQTITDNDTTHVPSADAVYDALLTESTARANADTTLGQNITAEATARANADTTLGQRINANAKEIANLKQKAGDEIVVDYPSSTYGMDEVPANVAEYAKVTKLRGVSRVANQLVNGLYIRPETYGLTREATADGGIRIYGTCTLSTSFTVATISSVTSGHSYLTSLGATLPTGCRISTSSDDKASSAVSTLSTATSFGIDVTSGLTIDITLYPIIRDLTQYFSSDPSVDVSTLTISDIQTNYPELLIPSDYDAGSLVSTTYSAVKSVGVNLWNEKWIVGGLNNNTGLPDASRTNRVSSEDFIPISQYKLYYYLNTADVAWLYFYDKDKNYIGRFDSNSASFTPLAGSAFMKFETWNGYGNVYKNDVQISEVHNNTTTSVNTTYHPYMTDTLTLPSPVTLRSAGSVAEEYYPETGRVTHPIGTRTYSANEVVEHTSAYTNVKYFYVNKPSNSKRFNTGECDGFTTKYLIYTYYKKAGASSWDDAKCIGNCFTGFIYSRLYFGFAPNTTLEQAKAQIDGLLFQYELATPSADTYVDPILDPFIEVEGGGTIRPIQTQTTEIDSAMTAEYLAV